MADLKRVYKAATKELAESKLDSLEEKWMDRYPIVIKSWRNNWERISQYFKYPEDIRRIIYTTNTIEAVHRQFRKLTKTKGAFPNKESLLTIAIEAVEKSGNSQTGENGAKNRGRICFYGREMALDGEVIVKEYDHALAAVKGQVMVENGKIILEFKECY